MLKLVCLYYGCTPFSNRQGEYGHAGWTLVLRILEGLTCAPSQVAGLQRELQVAAEAANRASAESEAAAARQQQRLVAAEAAAEAAESRARAGDAELEAARCGGEVNGVQ